MCSGVDLCIPSLPVGRCHRCVSLLCRSAQSGSRPCVSRLVTRALHARRMCIGGWRLSPQHSSRGLVAGCGGAYWPRHRRFIVRSSLHTRCEPPPPPHASGRIRGDARSTDMRDARRTAHVESARCALSRRVRGGSGSLCLLSCSSVCFLPPLLTPGGAAASPSFTRGGTAGKARGMQLAAGLCFVVARVFVCPFSPRLGLIQADAAAAAASRPAASDHTKHCHTPMHTPTSPPRSSSRSSSLLWA